MNGQHTCELSSSSWMKSSDENEQSSLWEELHQQHIKEMQEHEYRLGSLSKNNNSNHQTIYHDANANSLRNIWEHTAAALTCAADTAKNGVIKIVSSAGEMKKRGLIRSNVANGVPSYYDYYDNNNYRSALADFGLQSTTESVFQPQKIDDSWDSQHVQYLTVNSQLDHIFDENDTSKPLTTPLLHKVDEVTQNKEEIKLQLPNQNPPVNHYLLLEKFRLLPKNDGWGAVADLDVFFTSLYNYYYHRGLVPLVGKGLVELFSLFFSLLLSVFLFVYIDWSALFKCTNESTCRPHFNSYIIESPFRTISLWNFLVIIYITLFTAYGTFSVLSFIRSVRSAFEAKYIFEEKLGITARKLEGGAVEWSEIVEKIVHLQRSGQYRIAVHGEEIDPLTVVQRIMRRENFIIAFFNQGIIDLTIPLPRLFGEGGRSKSLFFSKTLEWSLYFCVLNYMFNYKYKIRPSFYLNPSSLQRRFYVCGLIHAIFMPFIIFFMVLHFFLQNTYDFRSRGQYFGRRDWSSLAQWEFREFNELQHVFERRLGPSYNAAEEYLKLFTQSAIVHSFGRALMFVSGSLAAVLLSFATVNDAILLHVKLGQWNLLWYVGVLGAVYSFGKGILPDYDVHPRYHHNLFAEMNAALTRVSLYTHYLPNYWKGRGWEETVKKSFSHMFQYRTQLFLHEILSVIVAPIILCHSLPKCALGLCAFVQRIKLEIPGLGEICGFSSFDLDLFEDESWEGENNPKDVKLRSFPKARMGKVQKSYVNFTSSHPNVQCSSSGKDLLDRIESFRKKQEDAANAEKLHHIQVMKRQLETLEQIEKVQENNEPKITVREDYISQTDPQTNRRFGLDSLFGNTSIYAFNYDDMIMPKDATFTQEQIMQQQYFWLDRFHGLKPNEATVS